MKKIFIFQVIFTLQFTPYTNYANVGIPETCNLTLYRFFNITCENTCFVFDLIQNLLEIGKQHHPPGRIQEARWLGTEKPQWIPPSYCHEHLCQLLNNITDLTWTTVMCWIMTIVMIIDWMSGLLDCCIRHDIYFCGIHIDNISHKQPMCNMMLVMLLTIFVLLSIHALISVQAPFSSIWHWYPSPKPKTSADSIFISTCVVLDIMLSDDGRSKVHLNYQMLVF